MAKFETIVDGVYEYTLYEGKWYYLMNKRRSQRTPIFKEVIEGTIVGVQTQDDRIIYKLEKFGILNERFFISLGEEIDRPIEVIAKLALE